MTQFFKDAKSIQFELTLEGEGCVNYDSSEQLTFLRNVGLVNKTDTAFFNNGKPLKNILLSKKNFRRSPDDENVIEYHVKVSSECLRNAIFKEGIPLQSPTVMTLPLILYRAIAHPDSLIRGYLYTTKGGISLKKKSPICITDAEEVGPWRRSIATDFHSRSGEKELKNDKDSDSPKDNTIYKIENVGNVTYKAKGVIDLQELAFISGDPLYDRMAVDVDGGENCKLYLDTLKQYTNKEHEFKYYYLQNAYTSDEWAERGILLDNETVNKLIKRALYGMLNISIIRRNSFLKTKELNVTINLSNGKTETVTLTKENIDDFNIEFVSNYIESDFDKIKANKEELEKIKKNKKSTSKQDN